MTGTIMKGMGGLYTVQDEDGRQYVLRARGRFRREGQTPMVGDHVRFTPGAGQEHGWLDDILPRKSLCLRPPVANLDLLLLVIAPVPVPDFLLIDRLMVYARQQAVELLLCVNKADMDPELAPSVRAEYAGAHVDVVASCALTGEGFPALREHMQAKRSCFAGPSGVGKSTLLGKLLGMDLKIGDVSRRTERGKHTTRHAELLEGNGLQVFDTPGFSLLGIPAMPPEALQDYYPEMEDLAGRCRFQPCLHDQEPGCAVRAALEEGSMSPARWERYRCLLAEVKEAWRNRYD